MNARLTIFLGLGLTVAAFGAGDAHAKAIFGDGVVGVDSDSGAGPALDSGALTLEVGTTEEGVIQATGLGDDERTAWNLPFIFDTFSRRNGNGGTRAQISSNGVVYFDRNNRGECRSEFENGPLSQTPNCRAKKVMPFFDDLLPLSSSTITRGSTNTGGAGDFWYIQWNEFALISDPDTRLTFRVTYYRDTRSVRFNYIKLEGAGADGSGATIGISDCTQRNFDGIRRYASLGFNQAVLPTGTAAAGSSLYAIEFGIDRDNDFAPEFVEIALGTSDSNADSDGCGEPDGTEWLNGRDPLTVACLSADDVTGDMDGDLLLDVVEALYGSDPTVADTDGDGADDFVEATVMRTDPVLSDTDGDGFSDTEEDLNRDGVVSPGEDDNRNGILDDGEDDDGDGMLGLPESSPHDGLDRPGIDLMAASGQPNVEPNHTDAFVDASGNLHLIAGERSNETNGMVYTQVAPGGAVTVKPTVVVASGFDVRKPHLHVDAAGMVTVAFTAHNEEDSPDPDPAYDYELRDVRLGIVQFDPASLGSAAGAKSVVPVEPTTVSLPGLMTHWSAVFGSDGTIHAVYDDHGTSHSYSSQTPSMVRYAHVTPAGVIARSELLAFFGNAETEAGYRNHRVHDGRIAIDHDGRIHIAFMTKTGPENASLDYTLFPNGVYHVILEPTGGRIGPFYIDAGFGERVDLAMHPTENLLYYAASRGQYGRNSGDPNLPGALGNRFAVIDLDALSVVPRAGDYFGIARAISPSSFLTPPTIFEVGMPEDSFTGPKLTVLPSGNALVVSTSDTDDAPWISTVSPMGELIGSLPGVQIFGRGDFRENRRTPIVPFDGGVALILAEWNDSDWRMAMLSNDDIGDVAPGPINGAPSFTSAAPVDAIRPGEAFTYSAAATDDSTVAGDLVWTLLSGPQNATLSDAGMLAWTPTASEVGDWLVALRVCDADAAPRCAEQSFVLSVVARPGGGAGGDLGPRIVSMAPGQAFVGRPYAYRLDVEDAELPADTLSYTIDVGQTGNMAIDADGLLTWTPVEEELGVVAIRVRVVDASGRSAAQTFSVSVLGASAALNPGGGSVSIQDGGCAAATASTWSLFALGAFLLRRRRRRV